MSHQDLTANDVTRTLSGLTRLLLVLFLAPGVMAGAVVAGVLGRAGLAGDDGDRIGSPPGPLADLIAPTASALEAKKPPGARPDGS